MKKVEKDLQQKHRVRFIRKSTTHQSPVNLVKHLMGALELLSHFLRKIISIRRKPP